MPDPTCPICRKRAIMTRENPARPFCSERCRWVDLSKWLGGEYALPDSSASRLPQGDDGKIL